MASSTAVKTVQLFYPDTKQLMQDFKIAPLESHDIILMNIRGRLGIKYADVYTQDANSKIGDLTAVLEGQILLISSNPVRRPQSYSPVGFKFYQGEESNDLPPGSLKKPWGELTEEEKKNHIISLKAGKPETRNTLRIVDSYSIVMKKLNDLKNSDVAQSTFYTQASSYQHIMRHWDIPFMLWLPERLKPSSLRNFSWDLRMLAALVVLAKTTPGQGNIVKDLLEEVVKARVEKDSSQSRVPTEQDVLEVINIIYERAGLIVVDVTVKEKARLKNKARQQRKKAAKQEKTRAQKELDDIEAMGPEAVKAAYLGKGEGKMAVTNPNQPTDQFKNMQTSQSARRRPVIDSDEDDK